MIRPPRLIHRQAHGMSTFVSPATPLSADDKVLLDIVGLTMRFGGLTAVDTVSFQANRGQVTAVIGPNGAGKTTLFNCLTGFYRSTAGQIRLHSRDGAAQSLTGLPAYRVARAGIARTFQNIRLFAGMTALENLLVADHARLMRASGFGLAALVGLPLYRRAEREATDRARFWLDRLDLLSVADRPAGTLPYGLQRRLEIARAMCARPRLLCLDEPAAGLNPVEAVGLRAALTAIRGETGIGILLIEHNMKLVMDISDRILVLDHGKRIAFGTPATIARDPIVIKAYLGEENDGKDAAA